MLSICTQTAIAILHDIAIGDDLQSANFLHPEKKWKDLFDRLEKGRLIRCLPGKEPGALTSYKLLRPLADVSLLDVLEATDEPIRCNAPLSEEFYFRHSQIANKVGVLNQVARTFLSEIKISDW